MRIRVPALTRKEEAGLFLPERAKEETSKEVEREGKGEGKNENGLLSFDKPVPVYTPSLCILLIKRRRRSSLKKRKERKKKRQKKRIGDARKKQKPSLL